MKLSRLLILVFAGIGVTVPLRLWVIEPIYVASGSMEPTLAVGTRRFSDKITLRLRPPLRGDIVLFQSPTGEALSVGKRVIALPGETFELRRKKVFIDGKRLAEPYAVHRRGKVRLVNDDLGPLAVPAGNVFVLGDNRDESEDSTVWKGADGRPIYFISIDAITGLVRPWF
jgi:signal peptidase I